MPEDRYRTDESAVDRVLADLTTAPPPPELRRRVLARIEGGALPRRGRLRRAAVPVAAAVAAATWVAVERAGRRDVPAPEAATTAVVSPPFAPAPRTGTSLPPQVAARPRAPRARAARTGRPAAEGAAPHRLAPEHPDEPALPSLAPPAPVRVAELSVAPIEAAASLEIPGLRVEPLSPPPLEGGGLP
jgi:hypothetical protein